MYQLLNLQIRCQAFYKLQCTGTGALLRALQALRGDIGVQGTFEEIRQARLFDRFDHDQRRLEIDTLGEVQKHQGAIKLHTALNNDVLLPEVITLANGKVADVKQVEAIVAQLPAFGIVVMDRGYNDYSLFEKLSALGMVFITRLKDNAVTTPYMQEEINRVDTPDLKYGEYLIRFTGAGVSEEIGKRKYRCIQWYDSERDRWFEFLTNDMDIPAPISRLSTGSAGK